MREPQWDKKLTKELVGMGIPWETARDVVGKVAEHRMSADKDGYDRGYESGYENGFKKGKESGYRECEEWHNSNGVYL